MEQYTEAGFAKAIGYFNESIAVDPAFAPGYAGLALTYEGLSSLYMPASEAMPKAKFAALRALAIDSTLAEPYSTLAYVKAFYEWKWAEAEPDFRRALELNPGSAYAYRDYSYFLFTNGRFAESAVALRHAREIDPLSVFLSSMEGTLLYVSRRYDAAIPVLKTVLKSNPEHATSHMILGLCYLSKREYTAAVAELTEANRLENSAYNLGRLGCALADSGDRSAALKILDRLNRRSRTEFIQPYCFAVLYVALGDVDRAFEWLHRGVIERSEDMCNILNDPDMDRLRSDPRLAGVLQALGFRPPPDAAGPVAKDGS